MRTARFATGLLLGALLPHCGGAVEIVDPRPPVILISWDAVRADHTSLYGYERDTTPNLRGLMQESVVFERAYTTQPFTLSHLSTLTGVYPSVHGVGEGLALSPQIPTLAERLSAVGYDTAGFYHPGWIHARFGFDRGFRIFREHFSAEQATRHLESASGRRWLEGPFFLFMHLFDAHCGNLRMENRPVYDPPAPHDTLYRADAREALRSRSAWNLYYGEEPYSEDELDALVALYDGGIHYVDWVLGQWLETWRENGILDRAILIVTSDHGEALGQRGDLNTHGDFFEEGLRVPLLVRFPDGYRAGERHADQVSLVDLVPTLLDALDVEADPWLSGYSLLEGRPEDAVILAERDQERLLIRYPWKLYVGENERRAHVFSLEDDPGELSPIRYGQKVFRRVYDRMLGQLKVHLGRPSIDAPAIPGGERSPEEIQAMRNLGYAGDTPGGE